MENKWTSINTLILKYNNTFLRFKFDTELYIKIVFNVKLDKTVH